MFVYILLHREMLYRRFSDDTDTTFARRMVKLPKKRREGGNERAISITDKLFTLNYETHAFPAIHSRLLFTRRRELERARPTNLSRWLENTRLLTY